MAQKGVCEFYIDNKFKCLQTNGNIYNDVHY